MTKTVSMLLLSLSALVSAYTYAADITIKDPWIQEAPPTSGTLACYLTIDNASNEPVLLQSASSEDFRSVEIHATELHDGMVHMNRQHDLKIGAGASLVLEPGGLHLMLIGKKHDLHAGDKVALKLHFNNGVVIDVNADVRK